MSMMHFDLEPSGARRELDLPSQSGAQVVEVSVGYPALRPKT